MNVDMEYLWEGNMLVRVLYVVVLCYRIKYLYWVFIRIIGKGMECLWILDCGVLKDLLDGLRVVV